MSVFGDYYGNGSDDSTSSSNPLEDGAFGLIEEEKQAFEEQTGTSWENATQEDINEARENQFNPILEETGAVNEDGSIDEDVHDDITEDPGDIHNPTDDDGSSTVIGSVGDGLGNVADGIQNGTEGLAGWADETADQAVDPNVDPEDQGFLQGLIDKAYKSSEEKTFWERQSLLDKVFIVGSALVLSVSLGPKLIDKVSDR